MKTCYKTGKQMFKTRAPAELALRRLNKVSHSNMGSVYLCQHCHLYHITHWGYEAHEVMDNINLPHKIAKKILRSQREKKKRLWYPSIPLRDTIHSLTHLYQAIETDMTKEEKIKIWESEPVRMARFKMEICYIMADVLNSFMLDAVSVLGRNHLNFSGEEKRRWGMMLNQAKQLKAASKQVAKAVYEADLVDEACEESDLMADLLLTIAQRVNDVSRDTMVQTYKLMKATIIKNFKNLYIEHKTNI